MRKRHVPFFFLIPTLVVLLVLSTIPLVGSTYLSLHNRDLRKPVAMDYIGFRNYMALLHDHRFWNSLKVSFSYLSLVTSLSITIGLVLTYLFAELKGRLRALGLAIFFLPLMVPRVSAALIWRFMFFPLIGVFSYLLSLFGIPPIPFLASPMPAFLAISIVDTWQWAPFVAALLISSIDFLPSEVIDAAKLDCNKLQRFQYIILPLLRPIVFFLALVKMLESMRSFDLIYNLTKGGPGIATETLDMYTFYRGVLWSGEVSYASAMSVIMLVITIVLMNLIWRVAEKWSTV